MPDPNQEIPPEVRSRLASPKDDETKTVTFNETVGTNEALHAKLKDEAQENEGEKIKEVVAKAQAQSLGVGTSNVEVKVKGERIDVEHQETGKTETLSQEGLWIAEIKRVIESRLRNEVSQIVRSGADPEAKAMQVRCFHKAIEIVQQAE